MRTGYYVSPFSKRDIKNIAVNLNFDMVGPPNYGLFVYKGSGSDTGTSRPTGSARAEQVFRKYVDKIGQAAEPKTLDGSSDYGRFIVTGIAAGWSFTSARALKKGVASMPYRGPHLQR